MSLDAELWDVVVVGGGPAGATCALHLARGGLRTLVLEKQVFPRYKTCGGGLTWRARQLLDLDLEGIVEHVDQCAELHCLDGALRFRVRRDRPMVSMTMRSELDRALLRAAHAAQARIHTPCSLRGLNSEPDGVHLDCEQGRLMARYVVAADGATSRTARAAGWPENPHLVPALESELEVPEDVRRRFSSAARFDLGVIPAGYGWVFTKRRHLSVGCLSCDRRRTDLRRHLHRYLERLGLDSPLSREDHGFVIPVAPRSARLARGRVLLIGDAAGLADPVTGEGLGHAILSGRLAAEALCRHRDRPTEVTRAYQQSLAGSILPELQRARRLAWLLYRATYLHRLVFRRLGGPLCEAMADIICGERSYRELLRSPARNLRAVVGLLKPPATS